MIRVGMSKPGLFFARGSNDMSHYTPSHWYAIDYFFMDLPDYINKREFSEFDMDPDLPKEEQEAIVRATKEGKILDWAVSPWSYNLNRLIGMAGGHMVWQFNAVAADQERFVRVAVAIGSKDLNRWSMVDVYIKSPVFKLAAYVLNSIRQRKVRREIAAWDKNLQELHSRRQRERDNG